MYISTEVLSLNRYGNNEQIIKLIKDTGFDAYDFTMYGPKEMDAFIDKDDYIERAYKLREYADKLGIVCNQTHSFFPTHRLNNEEWNKMGVQMTKKSLEVSGILGAKYCIVHPCNDYNAQENVKMYEEILPTAQKAGVKIALENMWNWDENLGHAVDAACSNHVDFCHHLDLLDKDWFVACLDIGHSEMKGLRTSAVEMILALSDRLKCLHVHDNDRHRDNHRLPYTYGIDYEPIIDALAKIDYQGDITFEADSYPMGFPTKLYPSAMKLMYDVGLYIKTEIAIRKDNK